MKISGKLCNNFISQTLGLMFRKPQVMIFPLPLNMKIQIHTWFVLGAINVFFLDDKKKVIELVKDLKQFRFYTSAKECNWIVETPTNLTFKVGDSLEF
jgi:uncharacterized membrane protein (UPF0127 family)